MLRACAAAGAVTAAASTTTNPTHRTQQKNDTETPPQTHHHHHHHHHHHTQGPGTQCDGEDWLAVSALPVFDFSSLHVYERHMELRPEPTAQPGGGDWPNWTFCGFECYIEW